MKNKIISFIFLSLLPLSSYAALPGNGQRYVEFKRILETTDIVKAFGIKNIDRIEYVKPDLYRVNAEDCFLYVELEEKPLPEGMVGARRFDIKIGAAQCPNNQNQ